MRAIFLDIDGVLNNFASMYKHVEILPEKVLLVNNICERTGAEVVISSAWRSHGLDRLKFLLGSVGLGEWRIIDVTPRGGDGRGTEIQQWLDAHDVESYVILDDNSDMLESQMENFVKTDMCDGLTVKNAEEAVKILETR